MKNAITVTILFFCLCIYITGCKEIDVCEGVVCENGGVCVEGVCDCQIGFIGSDCAELDASNIQAILDAGISPKEITNSGIIVDSLYGKLYNEGLIFYLNISDGSGLVAYTKDLLAPWGCEGIDIEGLNNVDHNYFSTPDVEGARIGDGKTNTDILVSECDDDGIAAKLCRTLGEDWFLPSIEELRLIYANLYLNGHGSYYEQGYWTSTNFGVLGYWSSTEYGETGSWYMHFYDDGFYDGDYKSDSSYVRAVKEF